MKSGNRIKQRFDEAIYGFVAGLIFGPFIGFWLYYVILIGGYKHLWLGLDMMSIEEFVNHSFSSFDTFTKVISICCIFNLAFFFLFMKSESMKAAKGVIIATFLFIFFVVARMIV